ncbi:hypothetical protein [Pseudoalteromonas tetraodonis]|uniref:hypothetical protein n=1 Tax=Pseudoalteromonas tetraodonis TaxID=43659 RepID=UPI00300294F5
MNTLIATPGLLIAAGLIISLVLSLSAVGVILSSGHQNHSLNEQPIIRRRPKIKRYGLFTDAVLFNGTTYFLEPASGTWLTAECLTDIEFEDAKTLKVRELDHKPTANDIR